MPAKRKYLTHSRSRFSKVTAAILGGYITTMLLHVAIAKNVPNDTPVIMTTAYSSFLTWVGFMTLAFFIKKPWHVWGVFGLISMCCSVLIFI